MIYAGVQEPVVTRKNIRKTEPQLINSDNGDHGKQKKKEKTTGNTSSGCKLQVQGAQVGTIAGCTEFKSFRLGLGTFDLGPTSQEKEPTLSVLVNFL